MNYGLNILEKVYYNKMTILNLILIICIILIITLLIMLVNRGEEEFQNKNKWSFVHIPKNGGTSIIDCIQKNDLPINIHGHKAENIPSSNILMVYRDPIERFNSAFKYSQDVHSIGLQYDTLSDFVNALSKDEDEAWNVLFNNNEDDIHTVDGKETVFTWVFEPQATWWGENIDIYFLRFSHLQEDWNTFLRKKMDIDSKRLRRKTQGKKGVINISKKNPKDIVLSNDQINFAQELYKDDFI